MTELRFFCSELVLWLAEKGWVAPVELVGVFHLPKKSGNSGWDVNGTRLFGSSHWKISWKSGTSEKVVPFSRWKLPNRNLCSIYSISRLYHQFHAFRGLLSGQASLGSLVFPKNGGWSESGFWKLFANKLQGYYECSACHVLSPDHENLLHTNVPHLKVVGRNSYLFEAFFAGARFPCKISASTLTIKFFRSRVKFLPL